VCRIDMDTGDSTVLLESGASFAELSPDGKTLYYSGGAIVRRQLDTGQEEKIFTARRGQAGFALSPDGQFIATGRNVGTEKKNPWEGGLKRVVLMPAQGGPRTELVRWDEPTGVLTNFAWSRDSKTVLFTLHREFVKRGDTQLQQITEFWQVPRDGGQPQKITETDLGVCYDLRVHPDGQRIAFFAAGRRQELWMMENFLPAGASAKDSK
jgi:Tol biopolymer transport system component